MHSTRGTVEIAIQHKEKPSAVWPIKTAPRVPTACTFRALCSLLPTLEQQEVVQVMEAILTVPPDSEGSTLGHLRIACVQSANQNGGPNYVGSVLPLNY